MKRILDCTTKDFQTYNSVQLKQAILAGEGRTICSEMAVGLQSVGDNVTHAEIARAFGADLMLFNGFDCFEPKVYGLATQENAVEQIKQFVGRPIGVNLEPIDWDAKLLETRIEIAKGRTASVETLKEIEKCGFDFVCFTGNPGTGVTNSEITKAIKLAKEHFSGLIMAGKMHGAGSGEPVCTVDVVKEFIDAGADIILVPAVGTVPGFREDQLVEIVQIAHQYGALVMSTIGTSQENASREVIEQMAIRNKMAGVDIQHIGDAGYGGLANVENIFALSVAIRGMRHTIRRVALSVNHH